jgi:hypothetical protein
MHQSPQKQPVQRRDKYGELEASSSAAERRHYRAAQPKLRKPRDDSPRAGSRTTERWN